MEEQDEELEHLGSLLLQQSNPSFMQRKWESRIRNRNFWARCSCNRVILHSWREEVEDQDQEWELLGSLFLRQSYPIVKQKIMQRGSFYLDTSPHDGAVNIETPHIMQQVL